MFDSRDGSMYRAEAGGAGEAKANNLAVDAILLGGEVEGNKGGVTKFSKRGSGGVVTAVESNTKLEVTETERGGTGTGGGVFSRAEEEEEGKADHVGNGHVGAVTRQDGDVDHAMEDRKRDGLDSVRGWVLFGVGSKHASKAEVLVAYCIEAGVRGPHCGERLANAA